MKARKTNRKIEQTGWVVDVPSFEWVLDVDRADKQGLCPVVLRQCYKGVTIDRASGLSLHPDDWDYDERLAKWDRPNGMLFRGYMARQLAEAIEGFQSACISDSICYYPGLTLVLRKESIQADGSFPVFLCYYHQGSHYFRATGFSLCEDEWDECLGQPKADSKAYQRAKCFLEEAYQRFVADIEANAWLPSKGVEDVSYAESGYPTQVGAFTELLIREFQMKERLGNAVIYSTTLNRLRYCMPSLDIPFAELDIDRLNDMQDQLKKKGLSSVSIRHFFKTVRAIWNRAIKAKVANKKDYPFNEFSFKELSDRTEHRALCKEDICRVIACREHVENDQERQFALDLFTFSYLCGGMPFYDIAMLRPQNIREGIIEYKRQKTHGKIRIPIPALAQEILDYYRPLSKGYLFPILDDEVHDTALRQRNAIVFRLQVVNRALKLVGKELNLPIALTTYVARHSFATVLQQEGVSVEMISEALGHRVLDTTKVYLAGLSQSQLYNIQKLLV